MLSTNALISLELSAAGAGGMGCGGPPQHNGIGAVCGYVGGETSLTKGGAMLILVLKGLAGILQVALWLLLRFCGEVDCKIG